MISVKLLAHTNINPLESVSHAAKSCYEAQPPVLGDLIKNPKKKLFDTGHHTTFQHFYLTFQIDNIAVGNVTLGLHLTSPFYNSSQRSGRFCADMFANPDYEKMESYLKTYWPEVTDKNIESIMQNIKYSLSIYFANIEKATKIAAQLLKEERPNASQKYININAKKIAQEQLRMLIPVIFPTGLDYTINLSALIALYESAWDPVMRGATGEMARLVVEKFPELGQFFQEDRRRDVKKDWSAMIYPSMTKGMCIKEPYLSLEKIVGFDGLHDNSIKPRNDDLHPVDRLPFLPEFMDNNSVFIHAKIRVSLATMGQDQRHRAIKRGIPSFTGQFYIPPILDKLSVKESVENIMHNWHGATSKIPYTMRGVIAPYGAVVSYQKHGTANAIIHEMQKRLCFCTQEEIYSIACQFVSDISCVGSDSEGQQFGTLFQSLLPSCFKTGKCSEGSRYCGKRIQKFVDINKVEDIFSVRKV